MAKSGGIGGDYPEHLNPFYEGTKHKFWKIKFGGNGVKRSSSFNNTFKDLRNTFTLKSFREKKKSTKSPPISQSPPVIRKHFTEPTPVQRKTLPAVLVTHHIHQEPVTPLPRSRISERIARSNCNSTPVKPPDRRISCSSPDISPGKNPFDEDEPAAEGKRVRRRKKRAPVPPKFLGQKINEENGLTTDHHDSKWSLASDDTEYSYSYASDRSEMEINNLVAPEFHEMLLNVTAEMEKLTDDSNNNVIVDVSKVDSNGNEEETEKTDDEIERNKVYSNGNKEETEKTDDEIEQNKVYSNGNKEKTGKTDDEIERNKVNCNGNKEETERTDDEIERNKVYSNGNKEETEKTDDEIEQNKVNSIGNKEETKKTENEMERSGEIHFFERKLLYITGSKDNLTKDSIIEEVETNEESDDEIVVPESPRMKTEINLVLDARPQEHEPIVYGTPVPKLRKYKLSKNELLGGTDINIVD